MTLTKVLTLVGLATVIMLTAPIVAIAASHSRIAAYVRRHIRAIYLTQAALWVAMGVASALGQMRYWEFMLAANVVASLCAIGMYAMHIRGSREVERGR